MREARLAKVRAGGRGSGWALGRFGILTARHVVEPHLDARAAECLVLIGDETDGAFECEVVWDDPARDMALLIVTEQQRPAWAGALGRGAGPALAVPGPGPTDAYALGYPDATVEGRTSHPELAPGRLLAGASRGRWTPFDVDSSVPDDSELWKGMSGAAVRDQESGRVLGLVVEADASRQQRRLYVSPLPDPASDSAWRAALVRAGAAPVLEAANASHSRRTFALLDAAGRPLAVQDVPDLGRLGVRRARRDLAPQGDPYYPYVERDLDAALREELDRRLSGQDDRLLLLLGAAMSGKSRSLAQAVRAHPVLRRWPVLVPRPQADPLDVDRLTSTTGGILWLDDAEAFPALLDHDVLRLVGSRPDVIMIGTLRRDAYGMLHTRPELRNAADAIGDDGVVQLMTVPSHWNEVELDRLPSSDTALRDKVAEEGSLGEVLGAADELRRRRTAADGRQLALLHAVTDWQGDAAKTAARAMITKELGPQFFGSDDLPEASLERLWLQYLPGSDAAQLEELPDDVRHRIFQANLDWLCADIPRVGRPLVLRTKSGFAVDDYLVQLRSLEGESKPTARYDERLRLSMSRSERLLKRFTDLTERRGGDA